MTIHSAPAVVYPVGRSRFQGLFLLGLWLTGLLCLLLWLFSTLFSGWHIVMGLIALLGAGASAWLGWKRAPVGQLAWDGQNWRWESASYRTGVAEYKLSVIADLQHILVLRLENSARAKLWLWPERHAFSERWLDLRRAVYSPQRGQFHAADQSLMANEPIADVARLDFDDPFELAPHKPHTR